MSEITRMDDIGAGDDEGLPLRTLARAASVAGGLQFSLSLQLSLLTPYVQELGISHTFATYFWLCGPVTGILVQPTVGHYSDIWSGSWGRRRPFIMLGATLLVVASLLIGFSSDLGYILGDSSKSRTRAIIVFTVGFWMLDIANNTLQSPCRALLADFTGKDHSRTRLVNTFFSLFMGVGSVLGFAAGSFNNWSRIFPFTHTTPCNVGCANLKSLFLVAIVVLILTTLLSLTAVEEIPWSSDTKYIRNDNIDFSTSLLFDINDAQHKSDTKVEPRKLEYFVGRTQKKNDDADSNEVVNSKVSIWEFLGTIRDTSNPIRFVFLINVVTWFAWSPFLLFDTDWMGREIYRGEPNSTSLQQEKRYRAGVAMGSFGLMLNSIVMGVSSLFIEPVCSRVHTSYVWASANMLMAACFAATAVITFVSKSAASSGQIQPPTAIRVSSLAIFAILGAPLAVTFSVPYALTATLTSSWGGGQGLSMGVLNLTVVIPQMVVSLVSGPWDGLFGGSNMPSFLFGAVAALIGGLLAMFFLPKTPHKQTKIDSRAIIST